MRAGSVTVYGGAVKWKALVVLGAVAGGLALASRRKSRRTVEEAELWAAATDPVDRFGD